MKNKKTELKELKKLKELKEVEEIIKEITLFTSETKNLEYALDEKNKMNTKTFDNMIYEIAEELTKAINTQTKETSLYVEEETNKILNEIILHTVEQRNLEKLLKELHEPAIIKPINTKNKREYYQTIKNTINNIARRISQKYIHFH